MKDSLSFPLLLATVFVGALLAVFDPANRDPLAKTTPPPALSPSTPQTILAQDLPS